MTFLWWMGYSQWQLQIFPYDFTFGIGHIDSMRRKCWFQRRVVGKSKQCHRLDFITVYNFTYNDIEYGFSGRNHQNCNCRRCHRHSYLTVYFCYCWLHVLMMMLVHSFLYQETIRFCTMDSMKRMHICHQSEHLDPNYFLINYSHSCRFVWLSSYTITWWIEVLR